MPNLKAYHRSSTIEEALQLLSQPGVNRTVLAGGVYLTANLPEAVDEVVDLQALGLSEVQYSGDRLTVGAMVRLQAIVDDEQAPALLRQAARQEGPNTLRNAATVGGTLAAPDKESEFLAALLVFEAEVQIQASSGMKTVPVSQFLEDVAGVLGDGIITVVSLATGGKTAGARVSRTPADRPIVAALARLGPDDRVRLALCGVAPTPISVDAEADIKAAVNPPSDFRGSSEYRRQMAATLAKRVKKEIINGN